jgi:hypothetical protein
MWLERGGIELVYGGPAVREEGLLVSRVHVKRHSSVMFGPAPLGVVVARHRIWSSRLIAGEYFAKRNMLTAGPHMLGF